MLCFLNITEFVYPFICSKISCFGNCDSSSYKHLWADLCWDITFNFLGKQAVRSVIVGYKSGVLRKSPSCLPKWLHRFILSLEFLLFHIRLCMLTLLFWILLFSFTFPWRPIVWSTFHILTCYLCIFCGKISVKVFGPFFFPYYWLKVLCTVWISFLYQVCLLFFLGSCPFFSW